MPPGKAGGQLLCELELYVLIREIIGEWKQNLSQPIIIPTNRASEALCQGQAQNGIHFTLQAVIPSGLLGETVSICQGQGLQRTTPGISVRIQGIRFWSQEFWVRITTAPS